MHKKRKILIIAIASVVVVLQLILVFYSIPFVKVNDLLKSANNRTIAQIEEDFKDKTEDTFISQSNYEKLRVVEGDVTEDEYVKLKTYPKIKFLNVTTVEVTCDVKATVHFFDDMKYLRDYNKALTITFVFQNGRWEVTDVK